MVGLKLIHVSKRDHCKHSDDKPQALSISGGIDILLSQSIDLTFFTFNIFVLIP